MSNCVFCRIANSEIPANKVWEDEEYVAFLDANPLRAGQTLVIPKNHEGNYVFAIAEEKQAGLFKAVGKTAKILEQALGSERICVVVEGLGVPHVHVKLYPTSGENEGALVKMGTPAKEEELKLIMEKIQSINLKGGIV